MQSMSIMSILLGTPGLPGNDGLPGGKLSRDESHQFVFQTRICLLQNLVEMDILVQKDNVVKMVPMAQM